jgi:replicative DNA helicase
MTTTMAAHFDAPATARRVESLRVPPHSIEAEQSVLGGLMLTPEAWDRVADKLTDADFYRRDHQVIFRAIGDLASKGMPCDAVTLGEWFEGQGVSEMVGGSRYVLELANSTPSAANIVAYAEIVREKSVLRQLIDAGTEIAGEAFQPEGRPASEIVELAEQKVFRIAEAGSRGRQGFVSMRSAVKEAFRLLQERYENRSPITGMPTGFTDFDHKTAGLQPGDLIIVAARPSMGKCLSFDSELVLADGSIATIESIHRTKQASLLTLGDDMRLATTSPSDFVDDGVKPVFEVTTRLGRRVESTAPHPFLTLDGWKPLAELEPGEYVAVPRRIPVFGDVAMRECEVKLLAYLIGDGGLTGTVPRFTATNPEIVADFTEAIEAFGGVRMRRSEARAGAAPSWRIGADPGTTRLRRDHFAAALRNAVATRGASRRVAAQLGVSPASLVHWQRGAAVPERAIFERLCAVLEVEPALLAPDGIDSARRNSPNPVTRWLAQHGLMGRAAQAKHVPAAVFRLPREQLALFLNRLFATDGWATVLASGQAQVGFASTSERLARQVQHLLLRFGIVAKLRQRWVRYRDSRRCSWQLDVTNADALRTFASEIGIHGKSAAVQRVLDSLAGRARRGNVDLLPAAIWRKVEAAKGAMSWSELARRCGEADSNPRHGGRRGMSRTRLARIAMVLGDAELAALASSDVVWDRVESIVHAGDRQVYDLTIPDTHNFVANDICVHNTALALNMAEYAAIKTGKAAAVFSMEMSSSQLAFRLISSLGRINQQHLRTGDLADEEWPRVTSAITMLSEAKIFIDDTPSLSPLELRARARRLKREHDLGLIVIDYLQLMQVPGNKENRATEISEISRSLKALAKELNVPVIALSQLNRSLEQRTDKRPVMADLRESGAIEQDADVIVFIYRDEYYNQDSTEKGVAEIIIGKQRNGPTGTVKLTFLGQYTRFENFASEGYAGSFE